MKSICILVMLLFALNANSQKNQKNDLKQTIDAFFEAFHAKDSSALQRYVHPNAIVQTIGHNEKEETKLITSNVRELIRSIGNIPDSVEFHEKLIDYTIQIDGAMANVWTPYEFWYNGQFHHCGVNSFQLFKQENEWKIIYLIDTRRKEDCK